MSGGQASNAVDAVRTAGRLQMLPMGIVEDRHVEMRVETIVK